MVSRDVGPACLLPPGSVWGLGLFINATTGEFPQKEQELFEGIVALIAVGDPHLNGFLDAQSRPQHQGRA
ncbi:Ferrous iron uptake protein [Pantoea agglomerans]|uniref:Ferrous iron uptake protein n=1 Tax=Enterobacter agglomerans TaxID=549 RepID=A0A379AFI0_ENTAG|nr:Ferrous iron uptake protein [Pantoea agglomerans]